MKLVYFAQDLSDPAIHRRVRMLRPGFSEIVLLGFRRSAEAVANVEGITPIDLGRTESGRLMRRVGSVLAVLATLDRHRRAIEGATVVLARNLEMLAIAAMAKRSSAPAAPLVFECLDIHRTMVSHSPIGLAVRQLEGHLLRSCDLLVVSSGGYLSGYFRPVHGPLPPTYVLENKVLESEIGCDPALHQAGQALPPECPGPRGLRGVHS